MNGKDSWGATVATKSIHVLFVNWSPEFFGREQQVSFMLQLCLWRAEKTTHNFSEDRNGVDFCRLLEIEHELGTVFLGIWNFSDVASRRIHYSAREKFDFLLKENIFSVTLVLNASPMLLPTQTFKIRFPDKKLNKNFLTHLLAVIEKGLKLPNHAYQAIWWIKRIQQESNKNLFLRRFSPKCILMIKKHLTHTRNASLHEQ